MGGGEGVMNVQISYLPHPFSPPTHPRRSPGLNCKRKKIYMPCLLPPTRRPATGPIKPPVVEPFAARRVDFAPPPIALAPPRWQLRHAWAEGASAPTPAQVCHRQELGLRPPTPAPHPPPLATSHQRPFFQVFFEFILNVMKFEIQFEWNWLDLIMLELKWLILSKFEYIRMKLTRSNYVRMKFY
jgi:hypothetical protein